MNIVRSGVFFYASWITLHYVASHLYVHLCVPLTWQGFLMSPLVAPGPHCVALRWAVNTGGDTIGMMWIMIAAAILSVIAKK